MHRCSSARSGCSKPASTPPRSRCRRSAQLLALALSPGARRSAPSGRAARALLRSSAVRLPGGIALESTVCWWISGALRADPLPAYRASRPSALRSARGRSACPRGSFTQRASMTLRTSRNGHWRRSCGLVSGARRQRPRQRRRHAGDQTQAGARALVAHHEPDPDQRARERQRDQQQPAPAVAEGRRRSGWRSW